MFMLLVDIYKCKLLEWLKFSLMKVSFLKSVAEAVWLSAVALRPRSRWLFICRQKLSQAASGSPGSLYSLPLKVLKPNVLEDIR